MIMSARLLGLFGSCLAVLVATSASGQVGSQTTTTAIRVNTSPSEPRFRTWKTNPGYYRPDYPLLFAASYRDEELVNSGNFGTDALEVGVPQGGQELWIMLTNGKAKKLFPIKGIHDHLVDESLAPVNGRILGAVTEPSVSIDGKRAYFSYFHNATDLPQYCCGVVGHSNFEGWEKGGDLYVIDLEPLLKNPGYKVQNLQTSRLTRTINTLDDAMNPGMATIEGPFPAGIAYSGALEIDNAYGRQLIFASTRRVLGNSNTRMTRKNKNYNLFTADIGTNQFGEYELSNLKQAQYYTTTSAISPHRMRVGYAFSYQSNTEEARQWHIQHVVGHAWRPLYGYGIGNELAHLATFCVKTEASEGLSVDDYTVLTRYYNQNNNGFGAIFAQPMTLAGLNSYNASTTNGKIPRQLGSVKLTANVTSSDYPSDNGKFTTPACGAPDELFLAYDPGVANHKNGVFHDYQPEIVFSRLEVADPATGSAYQRVIKGWTKEWAALWPKPVIDWSQRLTGTPDANGNAQQAPPGSPIDDSFGEPIGQPYALLGTSALYNTDITPVDCRANSHYYDPNISGDAHIDPLYNNIEGLSRLMVQAVGYGDGDIVNQTGSCTPPTMKDVFGIAVYLTSNRTSEETFVAHKRGYTTDNQSAKESKRLLGVFELGMQGQRDGSFKATIPANVPLDFHLLDRNGAKLADVRSWHSLKPREQRVDCGGCHNHRPNQSIDWSTSDSADPAIPALDMVRQTTRIEYDPFCQPTIVSVAEAAKDVPTWQDISTGFDTSCGGCHQQNSGNPGAQNAFQYDPAKLNAFDNDGKPVAGNPLKSLFARNYIDRYNANGSPVFWAAYGGRSDGRDNNLAEYLPDRADFSSCSDADPEKCGYHYTATHDNLICDGSNPAAARWVYELSQWIDNHAPIDIPNKPHQYHADRYHPTVESAFVANAMGCSTPGSLDIGFWDDSGQVVELQIDVNGSNYRTITDPSVLSNDMIYSIALSGNNLSGVADVIVRVTVTDAGGNRQIYDKTIDELIQECEAAW
jgi:hypothetical protein